LDIPIGRWGGSRWISFLGFANQIAGLVPFAQLQKDTILFFIFTGADAQLDIEEEMAMRQFSGQLTRKLYHGFGHVRGFLISSTFSDKDLQKVVITERAAAEATETKPKSE
jgi:hypothetical protein